MPKINLVYPEIQFHIVGKINFIDKIKLNFFKNVKVLGKINSLKKNIDLSICGVSNLQIATGVQNKIFTYMSYALPTIASSVSASGIKNLRNYKDFLVYQNNRMFINQIFQLKNNKTLAAKLSKNSYIKMKNFLWKKTLKEYYKII